MTGFYRFTGFVQIVNRNLIVTRLRVMYLKKCRLTANGKLSDRNGQRSSVFRIPA